MSAKLRSASRDGLFACERTEYAAKRANDGNRREPLRRMLSKKSAHAPMRPSGMCRAPAFQTVASRINTTIPTDAVLIVMFLLYAIYAQSPLLHPAEACVPAWPATPWQAWPSRPEMTNPRPRPERWATMVVDYAGPCGHAIS